MTACTALSPLTVEDHAQLARAVQALTGPSLAARLSALIGRPTAKLIDALPAPAQQAVTKITTVSLDKAFAVARASLSRDGERQHLWLHRGLAVGGGAVGGFFGLSALAVELPVSAMLMMRSVAAIARSQGEDLHDPAVALACLEVFALGSSGDPAENLSYFAVRSALAQSLSDAARSLAQGATVSVGGPAVSAALAQIARYFGVAVSQKVAVGLLPVIGAAGAAGVNLLFMEQMQRVAGGHFTLRALERRYGAPTVRHYFDRTA